MFRIRNAAAAALLLALPACQNALSDDYGPLTGTWRVTVTQFQPWAPPQPQYVCDAQTTFKFRQEGSQFEGVGDDGPMSCTNTREGTSWEQGVNRGVVRGEVENGRVHISNGGFINCFGEMHPTRIEGYNESYGSIYPDPPQPAQSGSCVLEKISDEGYYGPRA